jgi:uncharacterized protein YhaN
MKIQELHLAAFGSFTDKKLTFEKPGLHIVYGANEAGKSSALRGLKALLFGVDERTQDNFLHANDKLRVGGCLQTIGGQKLTFVRRKGRKNTLLTPEGEIIEQQVLAPFLQGVTAELFGTLFGIDHEALVLGGKEILEQKGEVGQALFSAALGSHALHNVLAQLDNEADSLFRPRGSTQKINSASKSYAELNKQIREKSLSSRDWDVHRRTLNITSKELKGVQSELAEKRKELNRLKRIQRVLPKLARRRELNSELKLLGEVVRLSEDFTKRRHNAMNGLHTAEAIISKATPRIDRFEEQLKELSINQDLLDQEEIVEDLHARLGGHRKALQDRPHLKAENQQLLSDVASILKEIRPALELKEVEELRPVLARRNAISNLGSDKAIVFAQRKQAKSGLRTAKTNLKASLKARKNIPESSSPDALRDTIAVARKHGDIDASIQLTLNDFTSLETDCNTKLSRLTLWEGELGELAGLSLPNKESINRFEIEYDKLKNIFQRIEDKKEAEADSLQETSLRLDAIHRAGTVPTETDLIEVRSRRDKIWQLLRRHWIDGEDVSTEKRQNNVEGALPDAFENRLVDADELSDRLRREAGRVQEMASLEAKQEALQRQSKGTASQFSTAIADRDQLDTDWQELWVACKIIPITPREMRAWLGDIEKLRDEVERLDLIRQKLGELKQNRKAHIRLLNQELLGLGEESLTSEKLDTVLVRCEGVMYCLEESNRNRKALDKDVEDRKAEVESLTEDLQIANEAHDEWKLQWNKLMQSFGQPIDSSPSDVENFVEEVRTLFLKQGEAEKLQIRIDAIDEDAKSFQLQVESLAASIAPELTQLSVENVVLRLNSYLSENRIKQTKRAQSEEQLEQENLELLDSKALIKTIMDQLDALCVEAKCDGHGDLEKADRKSADYVRIHSAVEAIELELVDIGEGLTITDLETEAEDVDPDLLPGELKELSTIIDDELEPMHTELAEKKGREKKELEIMDGGDKAAILADQAQAVLATIRADSERYVRVKLAGKILRDQIEVYRKANQGPLVTRAGEVFAALTLGSFDALMTDFNEKDEPILTGVRVNGERVHVDGMSTGTRDQLYLALRLASLEKYMESTEPMPFIVDDVLVDFDDERSEAALNALAELAEKTQVILFTHHSRVIEQAGQLQGLVQVHEL